MSVPSKRRRELQRAADSSRQAMETAEKLEDPELLLKAMGDSRDYVQQLNKEERWEYSKALNSDEECGA